MALKASIIMMGIAIGLLVIYGLDVVFIHFHDVGFLPFDHKIRGIGLGMPPIILSIVSFFISRKEPSKRLGIMLIASAILIIVGGIVVLALDDPVKSAEIGRSALSEAAPLFVIGAIIIALGIIKLKKS